MKWINWVTLLLGLWILVSPWVLAFSDFAAAMWSNVIAGVLVVIFALWSLFGSASSGSPTTS